MKIQTSKQMNSFFERCLSNIEDQYLNDFLGAVVTPKSEGEVAKALKKAKHPEFLNKEVPSLFISTEEFLQSPYHKQINLEKIESNGFQFSKEKMYKNELFNLKAIQNDPVRECNDFMILRALDQNYEAAVLLQDGDVWMLDVPSEAATIDPVAKNAKGHVLTFGLGIGYFIFMAQLNKAVTEITVIEQSLEVIEMFKKDLYPQFPQSCKVNFIHGNAFDYYNEAYLANFDTVFVDIYRSNDDGFLLLEQLCEQYNAPSTKVEFWIESSLTEFLTTMVFYFFYHKYKNKWIVNHNPFYQELYRKIDKYFYKLDPTITTVEQIKDYMYNPDVLRSILHTKS